MFGAIAERKMKEIICYSCKRKSEFLAIERGSECPFCHSDSKVCLNCKFYAPDAHRQCRESEAGWVKEKDRANFCSYFSPKTEETEPHSTPNLSSLEALFVPPSGENSQPQAESSSSLEEELRLFLQKKT